MSSSRPPYPGGKGAAGVYQRHVNLAPPHDTLIVPFAGHCAFTWHIRPARRTVLIDRDPDVCAFWRAQERPGTVVIEGDGVEYLGAYDWRGGELVYADPPYMSEVRSSKGAIYTYELRERRQHARLLRVLKRLPCPVMVCGYPSPLYGRELGAWREEEYQARTRGGTTRTEVVWCNFEVPLALHDYTHLGEDYRVRQDLRRMRQRWRLKFSRMGPRERYAMLAELAQLLPGGIGGSAGGIPSAESPVLATTGEAAGEVLPAAAPPPMADRHGRAAGASRKRAGESLTKDVATGGSADARSPRRLMAM